MADSKTLAGALSAFQALMEPVAKTRTARIPGKNGATGYSYNYADLSDIIAAAKPHLATCGLAVTQNVKCDGCLVEVQTTVWHTSGEQFTTDPFGLPAGNTPQTAGSATTYARRHSLGGALGIAAEEDDDGAAATHSADATKAAPAASGGVPRTSEPKPASAAQVKAVWGKAKALGMDEATLYAACLRDGGVDHPDKLSFPNARVMLDKMEKAIKKQEKAANAEPPVEDQLEDAGFEPEDLSELPEQPF